MDNAIYLPKRYLTGFHLDSFVTHNFLSDLTLEKEAVVRAAHRRGLKVTGHLCSVTYKEAAEAGIDNLEHGFMECSDFDTSKKENVCSENVSNSLNALDVGSKRPFRRKAVKDSSMPKYFFAAVRESATEKGRLSTEPASPCKSQNEKKSNRLL